jgi:hypothetical protein
MSTTVKTVSIKSACASCNKEFTKKTLDEHDGICGRCFNKKNESTPGPVLLTMPPVSTPTQYALPGEMLKFANLSVTETKNNSTLRSRLNSWYTSTKNTDTKNNAAADFVYMEWISKVDSYEKIPHNELISFEKYLSMHHKSLVL